MFLTSALNILYLCIFAVLMMILLLPSAVWAPDIDNFYGLSHFKDLPLLHPGETKSFEIKIENAAGSTLYDLTPDVSVYPTKSLPFISIQTDIIAELKNGQIGTIHGIIKADSRLPLEDLQLFVVFTAKDEDGKVLTGGWSDHLGNTISVQPLSPEIKTYHALSPLEQIKSGVDAKDVICREKLELIIKLHDNQSACVKHETIRKLVGRSWGVAENWIKLANFNDAINYEINGGEIVSVYAYSAHTNPSQPGETQSTMLIIMLDAENRGQLNITLPRDLIDAKIYDNDDDFFILLNQNELQYDETQTVIDRTLKFSFPKGNVEVEIIGYGYYNDRLPIPPL